MVSFQIWNPTFHKRNCLFTGCLFFILCFSFWKIFRLSYSFVSTFCSPSNLFMKQIRFNHIFGLIWKTVIISRINFWSLLSQTNLWMVHLLFLSRTNASRLYNRSFILHSLKDNGTCTSTLSWRASYKIMSLKLDNFKIWLITCR